MPGIGSRPLALALCAMVLAGCGGPMAGGTAGSAETAASATGPKVLTIALNKEPFTIQGFTEGGASSGRGSTEVNFVHSQLVVQDNTDELRPQLAVEVPSIAAGSWRINPDASMDMTWKLRPNVTWHDGVDFTSAD